MAGEEWGGWGGPEGVWGGRKNSHVTKVIIHLVSPPNKTFLFISLHFYQAGMWPENNSFMRQSFSHFLAPNLIEMSKLVGWLCQREEKKKKSRINHSIWSCICRKDVRKGQGGAKALFTTVLLLATSGPSLGLSYPDEVAGRASQSRVQPGCCAPASLPADSPSLQPG